MPVPIALTEKLAEVPEHTEAETGLELICGSGSTVSAFVVFEQPEAFVKVKVAFPAARPVTTPAFVTEATAGLLLTHVPPEVGESVIVFPTQTDAGLETVGPGFI
jgi:hypothetical protein